MMSFSLIRLSINRAIFNLAIALTAALLASCASPPSAPPATAPPPTVQVPSTPSDNAALPPARTQAKSRWVPVRWAELPGFEQDAVNQAWPAWLKSCERPGPVWAALCPEVRSLANASAEQQRAWMKSRLQPYRIESLGGEASGLLTSYFEPLLQASRTQTAQFPHPLYRAPASLGSRKPWFTRQEIDTLPEARAALAGREIAYLADPIDSLVLHIQGSGRLSVQEPGGGQRVVRVAFAGTNDQPYRSVNNYLASLGVTKLNPWPDATKAWAAQNPQRVSQMLWSNPRYVFFKEEALGEQDARFGPKGAQGVALTPGRSIAVDPGSIGYGTPVFLASKGVSGSLEKLVLVQDTGSAIVGAVRADYFAGTGAEAGAYASGMNQSLRLWALWPK